MRNERKPARRERQVGLEQALELEERLVVERHVVEIFGANRACAGSSARHCRKARVVLAAREALLLRRADDAPSRTSSRRVVIERGDAEDLHGASGRQKSV